MYQQADLIPMTILARRYKSLINARQTPPDNICAMAITREPVYGKLGAADYDTGGSPIP